MDINNIILELERRFENLDCDYLNYILDKGFGNYSTKYGEEIKFLNPLDTNLINTSFTGPEDIARNFIPVATASRYQDFLFFDSRLPHCPLIRISHDELDCQYREENRGYELNFRAFLEAISSVHPYPVNFGSTPKLKIEINFDLDTKFTNSDELYSKLEASNLLTNDNFPAFPGIFQYPEYDTLNDEIKRTSSVLLPHNDYRRFLDWEVTPKSNGLRNQKNKITKLAYSKTREIDFYIPSRFIGQSSFRQNCSKSFRSQLIASLRGAVSESEGAITGPWSKITGLFLLGLWPRAISPNGSILTYAPPAKQ